MVKDKNEIAKPASEEKKPEEPTGKKPKEVTVQVGDNEPLTGLCTAKRKTPSGSQVFLKIKGEVGRWFNADDVVK